MSAPTTLLPFQPATMSTAQLVAVFYLARYSGRTHALYAFQLRKWFAWCEINGPVDPWRSDRSPASQSTDATSTGGSPGSRQLPAYLGTYGRIRCGTPRSPTPSAPESHFGTRRSWPGTPTREPPSTTTAPRGNLDRHGVHFLTTYVTGV